MVMSRLEYMLLLITVQDKKCGEGPNESDQVNKKIKHLSYMDIG